MYSGAQRTRDLAAHGARVLQVLVTLGDKILPSSAAFESFAYELVRRRRTFEKLYRTSKRVAPRLVDAMALARSLIVGALEAIGQMDPSAAASLTAAQALDVVRGLHPAPLKPAAASALLKPPSQLTPHEQRGLAQSLLRVLLAHCRRDGSLAPLHYEDLVHAPA